MYLHVLVLYTKNIYRHIKRFKGFVRNVRLNRTLDFLPKHRHPIKRTLALLALPFIILLFQYLCGHVYINKREISHWPINSSRPSRIVRKLKRCMDVPSWLNWKVDRIFLLFELKVSPRWPFKSRCKSHRRY